MMHAALSDLELVMIFYDMSENHNRPSLKRIQPRLNLSHRNICGIASWGANFTYSTRTSLLYFLIGIYVLEICGQEYIKW